MYLSAHGRRRTVQPLRAFRRGRPRRRAREVRRAQSAGAAAGKRGKPSIGTRIGRTSRPATGTRWPRCWPKTLRSTIAVGSSTLVFGAVAMPKSRTCGRSPMSESRMLASTVIATRGERLALSRTHSAVRGSRRTRSAPRCSMHRRNRCRQSDRGNASCSTLTTSTPPSTSSMPDTSPAKRPPTRTRGRLSRSLCRVQSTRIASDDAGLGEHRPSARGGFAPGDAIPYIRAAWDVAPDINIYIEAVHRLSDLGAVVTQVVKGHLAAGVRSRVARDRPSDGRR